MAAEASSPHILVLDDDREIRALLKQYLSQHGFRVSTAANAKEMHKLLPNTSPDLLILDLMLPDQDGLSVCRQVRIQSQVPILMLTCLGEEADRIVGLEMGADDYLPKPFNPRELLARIKAILRRSEMLPPNRSKGRREPVWFAGWQLDFATRQMLSPEGAIVRLTPAEFDLLVAFVDHPKTILRRDELLDLAWGRQAMPFGRSIDVQVGRLRRKIERNPQAPELIKTVRGGGYVFTAEIGN